jgi:hypothetical protein
MVGMLVHFAQGFCHFLSLFNVMYV